MKALGIVFSNIHDKDVSLLTESRTIASVPFGGRYRLIDFVLSNMVNSGISKVGVITKSHYQSLMDHLGSGKPWDLARKNGGLVLLPPFGAVGNQQLYATRFQALQGAVSFIENSDEELVVMSDCNAICNFDYSDLMQYHIDKASELTIVTMTEESSDTDKMQTVVEYNSEGRVTTVKNTDKAMGRNHIYTNIIVTSRKFLINILKNTRENGFTSFSRDVLIKGAKDYRIFAYEMKGFYASINSISSYYHTSMKMLDSNIRKGVFDYKGAGIYTKVGDSVPARLESTARVSNSLISDGCVIEGDVSGSILFRDVKVARGARVINSIIMQNTIIGASSQLNCVIADKNAIILEQRMLSGHGTHPYFVAKNSVI